MLKNILKISIRSFYKNISYLSINLVGLGVAICSLFLIVSYIRFELSFDKSFDKSSQLYQLVLSRDWGTSTTNSIDVPEKLGQILKEEFPEVLSYTQLVSERNMFEMNEGLVYFQNLTVNEDFFELFDFEFVSGNKTNALSNPNAVVLTRSTAVKLFNQIQVVGLPLTKRAFNGDRHEYIVSAVIEDIPTNVHFQGETITLSPDNSGDLSFTNFAAIPQYVLLHDGASDETISDKLPHFYEKYNVNDKTRIAFLPITDIRLKASHVDMAVNKIKNKDILDIYIYAMIAILLLVMANMNYINLNMARSMQRIKEVGVRKVFGASRWQLSAQFMGESILLYVTTFLLIVPVAVICWKSFSRLLNLPPDIQYLFDTNTVLVVLGVCLCSALLSGVYPALILGRMNPVSIFRDQGIKNKANIPFRKVLVTLQFIICIFCITMTLVIREQLKVLHADTLGFEKAQLISLPYTGWGNERQAAQFKRKLLDMPGIETLTISSLNVSHSYGPKAEMPALDDDTKRLEIAFIEADFDFLQTMGVSLIEGRDFSADFPSDMVSADSIWSLLQCKQIDETRASELFASVPIIVSQSVVKELEIPHPAIGQRIQHKAIRGEIIGVISDFKGMSLKENNPLIAIRGSHDRTGYVHVRTTEKNLVSILKNMEEEWKNHFPNRIFEYDFVDEKINRQYAAEQNLFTLSGIFTFIIILINCFGLYSLVALVCRTRMKEISIRYVLGAKKVDIARILGYDYAIMMVLAFLITVPVTVFAVGKWLESYAYKAEVSVWLYGIPTIILACIITAIIFSQIFVLYKANLVKSLRND